MELEDFFRRERETHSFLIFLCVLCALCGKIIGSLSLVEYGGN